MKCTQNCKRILQTVIDPISFDLSLFPSCVGIVDFFNLRKKMFMKLLLPLLLAALLVCGAFGQDTLIPTGTGSAQVTLVVPASTPTQWCSSPESEQNNLAGTIFSGCTSVVNGQCVTSLNNGSPLVNQLGGFFPTWNFTASNGQIQHCNVTMLFWLPCNVQFSRATMRVPFQQIQSSNSDQSITGTSCNAVWAIYRARDLGINTIAATAISNTLPCQQTSSNRYDFSMNTDQLTQEIVNNNNANTQRTSPSGVLECAVPLTFDNLQVRAAGSNGQVLLPLQSPIDMEVVYTRLITQPPVTTQPVLTNAAGQMSFFGAILVTFVSACYLLL